MRGYRLYRLDGAGNINSADWLEAADDDQAIRHVQQQRLPHVSEIWDRNRLVARIEPQQTD